MSCTHDCGCSAETRDARTDDWGHTSPLSPQNADLREFQPAEPSQPLGTTRDYSPLLSHAGTAVASWVKHNGWLCPGYERPAHTSRDLTAAHSTAVGRGGKDSALTVLCRSCNYSERAATASQQAARDAETDIWPTKKRVLLAAAIAKAADGMGLTSSLLARPGPSEPADASQPLGDVPASERPREAVLPRPITPEDVRVGMLVERRNGECYVGGRVESIDGSGIWLGKIALAAVVMPTAWIFGAKYAERGWSLWLIEDAPAPVDPDAELVERMARAIDAEPGFNVSDMAYAALRALREIRDVTPRAEQ